MGMLSRMSTIVKSKMNRILDQAEDPRETLDYSYEKQLEMLRNVKRGVVEMVTAKRRIQQQATVVRENIAKLDSQARQALEAEREDLARLALQRKQASMIELQGLDDQIEGMEQEQEKLTVAERRLQAKVEAFKSKKEVIKAQYTAAQAQVRIGAALSGVSEEMGDISLAVGAGREQDRPDARPRRRHRRTGHHRRVGRFHRGRQGRHQPGAGETHIGAERGERTGRSQVQRVLEKRPVAHPLASRELVMIVRIATEGQFNLPGAYIDPLNDIDNELVEAVEAGDRAGFSELMGRMLALVREHGTPVPVDELVESDLMLPAADLTLEEAQVLFVGEGILPG